LFGGMSFVQLLVEKSFVQFFLDCKHSFYTFNVFWGGYD